MALSVECLLIVSQELDSLPSTAQIERDGANPSIQEVKAEDQRFKVILNNIVSSRSAKKYVKLSERERERQKYTKNKTKI